MTRARLRTPDHDVMVANIIDTYEAATPAQRDAGRAWYHAAGAMVRAIADDTGADIERVTFAMAALSPRNPWRWNVADAYAFACAARDGASRPTASTFTVNAERAWRVLTTADGNPWSTAAPKVRAFVRAILGDVSAVVVDAWAARVATAGAIAEVTDAEYPHVARAYTDAAHVLGEDARNVQAVTWIVASDAGLASRRRGRPSAAFKRGTAAFVVALFATVGQAGAGGFAA